MEDLKMSVVGLNMEFFAAASACEDHAGFEKCPWTTRKGAQRIGSASAGFVGR